MFVERQGVMDDERLQCEGPRQVERIQEPEAQCVRNRKLSASIGSIVSVSSAAKSAERSQ